MGKTTAIVSVACALALTLRAIEVTQPSAPAAPGDSDSLTPAAPVEDPAKPLGELVGKLSALDTLAPRDLADFATETIAYSQAVQGAKQQVSEKPIHDALAAVAQGRKLDPKAADWDDLQSRLEKFLEKPGRQKQDQQQQHQDKKDDQKQDSQKQDQQDQQNQSGDKNDGQQQDPQQQEKQDRQNQSGDKQDSQDQRQQQGQQDQKDRKDGDQRQSQQDKQQNGKDGGDTSEQPAKPQRESAFGDMKKKDDEKKDAPDRQSQDQPQQQPQPQPRQEDMQQVGGSDGKNQQPIDSRMIIPLQQLDQVRDKDSPAILFQRMQAAQSGTTQIPAPAQKPKGKDW